MASIFHFLLSLGLGTAGGSPAHLQLALLTGIFALEVAGPIPSPMWGNLAARMGGE